MGPQLIKRLAATAVSSSLGSCMSKDYSEEPGWVFIRVDVGFVWMWKCENINNHHPSFFFIDDVNLLDVQRHCDVDKALPH